MIIFLYGKDGYRLKRSLEKIVGEYKKKHASGMSFSSLDLLDTAPGMGVIKKLEDTIKTVSFFGEKRLMVIKNGFAGGQGLIDLIKTWDLTADKQNILVFTENLSAAELAKKDKKFFNLLTKEPNIAKSFEPLGGRYLENWVAKEIESLGAKIDKSAVKKLIDFAGSDSWRLRTEIEKLANYSRSQAIDEKAVESLVAPPLNFSIFEAIDALGSKNKGKALLLLARHLEAGEDPHYLFSMIVYQFRNLLRVKSLLAKYMLQTDIAQKTGLHPYVVRKVSEQARNFELAELKQKFSALAQNDIQIKSGQLDIVDCLYQTVLN